MNFSRLRILCLCIAILINIFKNESHLNHSFTDNQYVPCHILTMEHLLSGSRFIWGKVGLSNWMAWLFCLPFIITKTYHLRLKKCYVEDSYYCTKLAQCIEKLMRSFVNLQIPSWQTIYIILDEWHKNDKVGIHLLQTSLMLKIFNDWTIFSKHCTTQWLTSPFYIWK